MTILEALREKMADRGIDVYVVPTDDFHGSEYVGDYFKCREYLTGFTGSAGTAFVAQDEAGLYTDGRYYLQAEEELRGSGFTLYRMGEAGVPTLYEKIESLLPEGGTVGFDGRVVSAAAGRKIEEAAAKKFGSVDSSEDLVGLIWEDRPALSKEQAWILPERFSGESAESKIARVRSEMEKLKADVFVLTSLTDVAWLLNLRGNDVSHCPVVLSNLLLTAKGGVLYVQNEALTDAVRRELERIGVSTAAYESIYEMAGQIRNRKVLLSTGSVNDRLYRLFSKGNEIIDQENPTLRMKAVKNETEVRNIKNAHVKDGVAMTRWLYWLKKTIGKEELTEISVSKKLEEFRANMRGFMDLSFETIAGYKEHGAIVHYEATKATDKKLAPESFLLVDSGGHYMEGTTDITRTVALGKLTDEEKEMFTTVLKGHLSLLWLRFMKGCSGLNFDVMVRKPFWEKGLDYRHGTGHGVGYLLSVHEAPNGFRYKTVPERNDAAVMEPGMVTTDEPGVYLEGKFGVRTESELLCREDGTSEYGDFLTFEPITYCPIDLDAVVPELLSEEEKEKLNRYHGLVFDEISPYLEGEEKEWLRQATRRID